MTASLRGTALLWMTGLLTIVGVITIVIAYWFARSEAADFLDGQLRQIALNAGTGIPAADAPAADDQDPEDQFAITIWGEEGRVVHASSPAIQIPRQSRPGYANLTADGEGWRVYTTGGASRTVQVAQRDRVRQEIAQGTALGAALPIIIVIPLSWIVVGWAMNLILKQLNLLADDLGEQSVTAARPIPLAAVPTEVVPFVESMNGLIVRLQVALAAQKRFVADAAHELRTPLAAMQIQVDALASSGPATFDERRDALANGVKRASALVAQLLKLARLDEPAAMPSEAIDLGPLLLECVGDHVLPAGSKGVDLGVNLITPTTTYGTADDIRTLLGSLIDNAVRYTPQGGTIDVSLFSDEGSCVVEVLDSGPGLPEHAGARIFERFFRAAPAGMDGAGLGLAIALRIAERHGFKLTVENRADGVHGVVARVFIPAP